MHTKCFSIRKDFDKWQESFSSLPAPLRDLHYSAEFFKIYDSSFGHHGRLFICENQDIKVFYPFIEKEIHLRGISLPSELNGFKDIESVYGYGGPLFLKKDSSIPEDSFNKSTHEAMKKFETFCKENKYVSEFCIIHPFLNEAQHSVLDRQLDLEFRKSVAYFDLTQSLETIWSKIDESQRKAIAVARKRGIKVISTDLTPENIQRFQKVYIENMTALNAGQSWFFPDSYYPDCARLLGRQNVSLFSADLDGTTIAQIFLIHDNKTLYYHFAASVDGYSRYNPILLLLFDSLIWGKAHGFQYYHLGGGRTSSPTDSLYRFKYSLSQTSASIYSFKNIFLPEIYSKLSKIKEAFEVKNNLTGNTNFFPTYRR